MTERSKATLSGTIWRWLLLPAIQISALVMVHVIGFMVGAQFAGVTSQSEKGPSGEVSTQPPIDSNLERPEASKPIPDSTAKDLAAMQTKQAQMFGLLVGVCLLNSAVMVWWVHRCSLRGLPLAAGVFLVFFVCMTVMPQSDVFLYLKNYGAIMRPAAVMGFFVSAIFAIATIPVMGRWRKLENSSTRLLVNVGVSGYLWRTVVSTLAYVAIYLLFGYFVAWQNPELRSLYGGSDQVSGFFETLISPPVSNKVIPFQLLRGLIWTLLCVGMIGFSRGNRLWLAIVIGLVLAVVMNSQLLLPNPIMSWNIRFTHMLETATSNFLFGFLCVLLWTRKRTV